MRIRIKCFVMLRTRKTLINTIDLSWFRIIIIWHVIRTAIQELAVYTDPAKPCWLSFYQKKKNK
ncbi:MAG: hypothetical protein BA874_06470 [Desulfuromonadales bacterium C00003068]|nr:MAG: hypothetical protein BA874_06470 [Desulfuromonadales bacterium C00003068]